MKARIRGTNIELDVQPFYDETGYFSGFKDGYEYYRAADLVFPETPDWDKTDWSSFRREAAKDIFSAFASNPVIIDERPDNFEPDFYSKVAVEWADSLVRFLKKWEEQK